MRYLVAVVILISGAWVVATSGCLSNVERDPARCNLEFPDCPGTQVCYGGLCLALDGMLPDGFTADGVIIGACNNSSECTNIDQPLCTNKKCMPCQGMGDDTACRDRDNKTPRCAAGGRCVACRTATQDTDCGGTTPFCTSDGMCRKCETHTECGSGVCKTDGSCASALEVAYVDNKGVAPTLCAATGTHDGTSTLTAYCDIKDAAGTSAKPFVRVAGHAGAPYNAVNITDATLNKNFTVVGPGRDTADPAYIYEFTKVGFNVQLSGGNANIVLDGIEVGDRSSTSMLAGVQCNNSAAGDVSLTLKRAAVQKSGAIGLNASGGCSVTVVRSRISGNAAGGMSLTTPATGQFTVVNNFITLNTGGFGVTLAGPGNGTFALNTMVKNQSVTSSGGIDCGNGITRMIQGSIIIDNIKQTTSQFAGNCTLGNVVTGSDSIAGDIEKTPDFVNGGSAPFDFHLKKSNAANQDCCVDKLMGTSLPFSTTDVDGNTRPAGNGSDIGAHEVE